MAEKAIKVALVGNPNVGKTSLFNQLTGLQQRVGNYPGITVDKKIGKTSFSGKEIEIIDLPGTYSIHPASSDEKIVINILLNPNHKDFPDVVVVIADVTTLSRNLLLFTQVKDLGIPTLLVINMEDQMARHGITLNIPQLEIELETKITLISAKNNKGISSLKAQIVDYQQINTEPIFDLKTIDEPYFESLSQLFPSQNVYVSWLHLCQKAELSHLDASYKTALTHFENDPIKIKQLQHKETIARYKKIRAALQSNFVKDVSKANGLRYRLDKVLTHKIFGYLIFAILCLVVFESVFSWSAWPMDKIDQIFAFLSNWTATHLPAGPFTDLVSQGILPGLGGIIIFIPQIAILFFFIAILEESGYMSRVVFLMDNIMRRFGLSGKSVVPFISGTACAIPAIMATRNIENWKERLISILVIPFITCSARLPVYAILIALVIPNTRVLGIFGLQGLTLMALYLLGFAMALMGAAILNQVIKMKSSHHFIIELPDYRMPIPKNVFYTVFQKSKAFVLGAGKIILAISIILWFLASNGSGEKFKNAEEYVTESFLDKNVDEATFNASLAAYELEHSYIGKLGNFIEPAIAPLGYDWKIGIALVSSFAAREIFVGTLATIYSIGNTEDKSTILQRLQKEKNPETGGPRYTLAVGISLLLFYALAMQCMSTLVIVKQETKSWKWPFVQLFTMSGLAYLVSFIAYQILK
jgi:ferrous iron transport protein B